MIESILARYAPATGVAVYAVPDPVAGDQVARYHDHDRAALLDR